ncbi:MAG: DUF58 domain-containing protein [Lachnospiraceae bacterium]|nr:DUF58 domain-containing protein [Lachnospiraceae bacterium]
MLRNRIILIILWILSLVGISFYGGAASYGMFAAATLVPVMSLVYLFLIYLRFKIYQKPGSKNLVAQNVSDFYITLQNEDFFAYSGIRILFYSSFSAIEGIDEGTEYELLPRSGIKKETTLLCRYRGEYEVGVKSVEIRDFLNIFRFTYHNPEPFRVTVLPQIIQLDSIKSIEAMLDFPKDSNINPMAFDAVVREYIPGDDIRSIHWKASAKQGRLFVRTTVGEEKQGIGIIMDSERPESEPGDYLPLENKILETVIAAAMYYVRNNTPVRVYSYQGGLSDYPVSDMGSFDGFYRNISSHHFSEENGQDKLFTGLRETTSLFESRLVIMVLFDWSMAAKELAALLSENNCMSIVYIIKDKENAASFETGRILPRCQLFVIPPDADLKEVL